MMATNNNYKMSSSLGNTFHDVAKKAQEIATKRNVTVEFEFNGIICLVNSGTNLDWLFRDYCNAWIMDWKEVGANCLESYSKEVQLELDKRNHEREEKAEMERLKQKKQTIKSRKKFESKVEGVEMQFSNKEGWDLGLSKNQDAYGNCVYQYAEGWAKLMQIEIEKGSEVKDIAEKTSEEMDFLGITGFMYGAAVGILSNCWKYGEELRKWHNKEYNHEGEGVVNPAILTIK